MKLAQNTLLSTSLILFLFFSVNVSASEKIRMGIDEMPPYISQEMEYYGFLCRIITEVFAAEGIEVVYEFVPWNRAILTCEAGHLHGTPGWFRTPEREKTFYVTDPLVDDSQSFFHLKDYKFDWNTIEDLKGIRIGATLGYNYGDEFAKAEKEKRITVERIPTDEQNFQKLLAKRIDIFPMNTLTGYSMLNKLFSPQVSGMFTTHPKPIRSAPLHLLLSKKIPDNERLLKLFNNGLQELKESGKYEQYLNELIQTAN